MFNTGITGPTGHGCSGYGCTGYVMGTGSNRCTGCSGIQGITGPVGPIGNSWSTRATGSGLKV